MFHVLKDFECSLSFALYFHLYKIGKFTGKPYLCNLLNIYLETIFRSLSTKIKEFKARKKTRLHQFHEECTINLLISPRPCLAEEN